MTANDGIGTEVFDKASCTTRYTPWGAEVARKINERKLAGEPFGTQIAVGNYLKELGFDIDKGSFSNMLKGSGVSKRWAEIAAVNELLGISFRW